MEEQLKAIATTLDIDVRILKEVYGKGYSDGFDTAYHASSTEPFTKDNNYQTFNTEKAIGQRE